MVAWCPAPVHIYTVPMQAALQISVREGTHADIEEIVRLRRVMIESIHDDYADDGEWLAACAEQLRERMGTPDFVVLVVDHPSGTGRLIATGAGMISRRLPAPGNPSGRVGYIQSMITEEEFRQQGVAHTVFERLMEWFDTKEVTRVDLHASPGGARIYRKFGFTEGDSPELRFRK